VTQAFRGQVYRADVGYGRKPWVVVSNNQRNRNLNTVIAARITTTDRQSHLPTIVELAADDPLVGYANCDDLVQLYDDHLTTPLGALSPATMQRISAGLRIALP
jgi:mRNA interferase MazF